MARGIMRQIGKFSHTAGPAFALACLSALGLAACAPPGAGAGSRSTMSADCKSMQRQQQAMVAKGQQNTAQYRQLLDTYLRRCGI